MKYQYKLEVKQDIPKKKLVIKITNFPEMSEPILQIFAESINTLLIKFINTASKVMSEHNEQRRDDDSNLFSDSVNSD
jgi:hypothetical protein